MKVIIAGCRHFTGDAAKQHVRNAIVESGWTSKITEIVHGGAPGIDTAAHYVATGQWPITVFPAHWEEYGRKAGPIRNREMAKYGDALIAVWDNRSNGTRDMITVAMAHGIPVHIHEVLGGP